MTRKKNMTRPKPSLQVGSYKIESMKQAVAKAPKRTNVNMKQRTKFHVTATVEYKDDPRKALWN